MAGNAYEWTMETYNNSVSYVRVYRGGKYSNENSGYPASTRNYNNPENKNYSDISFRVALYLK